MPETRQLDPDDVARIEALQIESRALRQVIDMQHAAATKATADLMSRTARFWTETYARYNLVPGEPWAYQNGMLTKVEPPPPPPQPTEEQRAKALQAAFSPPDGEHTGDDAGFTGETVPSGQKPN